MITFSIDCDFYKKIFEKNVAPFSDLASLHVSHAIHGIQVGTKQSFFYLLDNKQPKAGRKQGALPQHLHIKIKTND
jgi:hypothetical protein